MALADRSAYRNRFERMPLPSVPGVYGEEDDRQMVLSLPKRVTPRLHGSDRITFPILNPTWVVPRPTIGFGDVVCFTS